MLKGVKKKPLENVVLGHLDVSLEINGCVQIIKTGPNKGKPCGCKISTENLCGRHYNNNKLYNISNN